MENKQFLKKPWIIYNLMESQIKELVECMDYIVEED